MGKNIRIYKRPNSEKGNGHYCGADCLGSSAPRSLEVFQDRIHQSIHTTCNFINRIVLTNDGMLHITRFGNKSAETRIHGT